MRGYMKKLVYFYVIIINKNNIIMEKKYNEMSKIQL